MLRATLDVAIAAAALAFAGCANQGFKVVSVTYECADLNRQTSEWRALLMAQDQCYFTGFEYAQAVGPPQIAGDDAASGEHRATRYFNCVGLRGGEG